MGNSKGRDNVKKRANRRKKHDRLAVANAASALPTVATPAASLPVAPAKKSKPLAPAKQEA